MAAQIVVALQRTMGIPGSGGRASVSASIPRTVQGARRIDMAEIKRLGSQLFQFRSQLLPIVAEFAEEFRAMLSMSTMTTFARISFSCGATS